MLIHGKTINSVNGPGRRIVIHTQGCGLGCPGCWNPDTHAFIPRGHSIKNSELLGWILCLEEEVEGVTFSGGEPMQQAPSLAWILESLRAYHPEWSLGMYTGYTQAELDKGKFEVWQPGNLFLPGNKKDWRRIQGCLDFAVMGRYNQLKQTSAKPMCGSANQDLVLFTDRYRPADFAQQKVEITLKNGLIEIAGFPVGMHKELDREFAK